MIHYNLKRRTSNSSSLSTLHRMTKEEYMEPLGMMMLHLELINTGVFHLSRELLKPYLESLLFFCI